MKSLNFNPSKSGEDFRKNYKLHDLAEYHGKNLFFQWGIDFKDYGRDRRHQKVWEKGEDKPDIIAEFEKFRFLIDWKGKSTVEFLVNKRAINSYLNWSKKLGMEVIVCFFIFDKQNHLKDRRFASLTKHKLIQLDRDAWDKNKVVKFNDNLPKLTRLNLIEHIVVNNNLKS